MFYMRPTRFDNLIDRVFGKSNNVWEIGADLLNSSLPADLEETSKDNYLLTVTLPAGSAKENVTVSYENDYLTVSVKRENKNDSQGKKYIYKERSIYSDSRSFFIPNLEKSSIKASVKNCELTVNMSKQAKSQETTNLIPVEWKSKENKEGW